MGTLRGPVRAEVVLTRTTYGGLLSTSSSDLFVLEAETRPETTVTLEKRCEVPFDLVSDPTGARLALRCQGGPWNVVYLGSNGRGFWSKVDIAAPTVDWAAVPSLDRALADLFRQDNHPRKVAPLVAEARAIGGDARLATLLLDAPATGEGFATHCTASAEGAASDVWTTTFDGLADAEKQRVRAALREALRAPIPSYLVFSRSATMVEVDEAIVDAAIERAREAFVTAGSIAPINAALLLRKAARRKLGAAGEAACRILEGQHNAYWPSAEDDLLALVAASGVTCPAGDAVLRARACDTLPSCGEGAAKHPCTGEDAVVQSRARIDRDCAADEPRMTTAIVSARVGAGPGDPRPNAGDLAHARAVERYPLRLEDGRGCDDPTAGTERACQLAWMLHGDACKQVLGRKDPNPYFVLSIDDAKSEVRIGARPAVK